MNQVQVPAWVSKSKGRSVGRRELRDEINEAVLNADHPMLTHADGPWDESHTP